MKKYCTYIESRKLSKLGLNKVSASTKFCYYVPDNSAPVLVKRKKSHCFGGGSYHEPAFDYKTATEFLLNNIK